MRCRLDVMLLVSLVLAGSGASEAAAAMTKQRPAHPTTLPRPRDPNIAVQEELDAARRAGTLAAYDLFLQRHGEHALAKVARRERARIASGAPHPRNR